MEIALVCVLVGVGRLIGVKVDASELVVELKHLIQTKRPEAIRCSADQLELYLAKRSGVWLSTDSEEFKAMRKGEIPDMIKELMQDHLRMGNVDQLDSDECFGTNFQPGGREVHFLVKLPGATQHATTAGPSTTRTESRLKRWRELNEIYDETKKSRANSFIEKTDGETSDSSDPTDSIGSASSEPIDSIGSASSEPIDSTLAPASVGWSDVEDVFDPIDGRLAQILKPIPDDVIDALAKNVTIISRVTRGFLDMSVGVQRQLIGPVLITICNLFDDMKLDFDRTVTGNQIHAQIQLDFVFTRGKKTKMCVAHAKHGDFEQARAQVLVASEAIAEREDQHVVYGLVTDFVSWHLFRSGEKSIAMDGRMMYVLSGELDKASLRDVCEMIYGALADHEEEDKRDHQLAMHERYSLY